MKYLILSLATLGLVACGVKSADVYGDHEAPRPPQQEKPQYPTVTPDKIAWQAMNAGNGATDFNPRVDILFVVDNSDSMKDAEENLQRNVDSFASALRKNQQIDYHIGVTSVWDSSDRYTKNPNNIYKAGELWNVRDAQGNKLSERFVTKTSNDNLLATTLNIGIEPYAKGGPENEEMFSPIDGAIHRTGRGDSNEGFFRDDAKLVVVILSDADDSTGNITPDQLATELFNFKNGQADKVSVYAALVKASDPDEKKDWGLRVHPNYHPECFTNGRKNGNGQCATGFGPDRLINFVLAANAAHGTAEEIRENYLMSLIQKDFGHDLARIGQDIVAKNLPKEIALQERPRLDEKQQLMLRVHYGTQGANSPLVSQSQTAGWTYDASTNSIIISGNGYKYQKDAQFTVEMVPVTVNLGH